MSTKTATKTRSRRPSKQNPKHAGPKPPFPQEKQRYPGADSKMQPKADHGEESYRGAGRLQNHAAIITGADSGIGRAAAIAFAREGADVLNAYLCEDHDAEETARRVEQAGRRPINVRGDIQDPDHCRALVEQAYDEFGRLDILVNNSAFQMSHEKLEEFTPEEIDRTYRTNIMAMYYLCQAAVPLMKAGSSIINVASIQAYDPSPNLLAYAPTKAAIVSKASA
jgi:NAD(P)-dependent dehydrogenase (short-subunit alcohol dehydrogenase family)